WRLPTNKRVNVSEVPSILISLFGRLRSDSHSNLTKTHTGGFEASGGIHEMHSHRISQVFADDTGVGKPIMIYSSKIDAPFELFAVKWDGKEITGLNEPQHEHENWQYSPATQESPAMSATGTTEDAANKQANSQNRSRSKSITHRITKHLHRSSHSPALKLSIDHQTQYTPSSATFRIILDLPKDMSVRSIPYQEWDPEGLYSHILVDISAATGSPIRIYEGISGDSRVWYWVVGRVIGKDVLVGACTFAIHSTFAKDKLDQD
ncbi:uncharacterized protein V1516DRAFT_616807, partial [Lipomyces oligophaga]|uniref:uncharacterized protein n=1 Tax=Lipomyces oligophaga TaxID=45792 RepID=UPI0034CE6678